MPALPSASAARNVGVAAAIGAGLALVGISVSGIAGMDGTLRAASERSLAHHRQVSYVTSPGGDCPHPGSRPERRHQPPPAVPTT
jgi:hypothetical protein